MPSWDVVVVGGGVAGATALHALVEAKPDCRVLLLERGAIGRGSSALLAAGDTNEALIAPGVSGTAVFEPGRGNPTAVKMIVSSFPATAAEWLRHHSEEDGRTWFALTRLGLQRQKEKARRLLPEPGRQLKEEGSLCVGTAEQSEALSAECRRLQGFGARVEMLTPAEVTEATGGASGFACGMRFPDDAVIDSVAYAAALVAEAQRISTGLVEVRQHAPEVVSVADVDGGVEVRCADGAVVRGRQAVVATGGFFHGGVLAGLLRPCYSYLVSMPAAPPGSSGGMAFPTSPNFYTYGVPAAPGPRTHRAAV